jgi:predicted PurR-regulated permease PerM
VEKVSKATEQLEKLTTLDQDKRQPVVTVESKRTGLADIFLNTTVGLLTSATVMFILLYFLLASGDLFLLKLVRVLPSLADKKIAVTIVRQIQEDISHYLSTITVINIGLGIAVGLAMFCLGMPNPVLWGVMAGALNFIPYLGALVSIVVLTFVAILSFEDLGRAIVVPLVFVSLTSFEGLLITPTAVGRRLTLNPVVIFVWLTFWGWMWGIAGTLLAVPLLATLKILCDYIKPLTPIGEFLSR